MYVCACVYVCVRVSICILPAFDYVFDGGLCACVLTGECERTCEISSARHGMHKEQHQLNWYVVSGDTVELGIVSIHLCSL